MTGQTELDQELAKLQDQLRALRENTMRTTDQMREMRASLGHSLARTLHLVHELEQRIHELEAHVAEAHQDAHEPRQRASASPAIADSEAAPVAQDGAELDRLPEATAATDRGQASSSDPDRATGDQEEIQEQMVQTLAALRKWLGEINGTPPRLH